MSTRMVDERKLRSTATHLAAASAGPAIAYAAIGAVSPGWFMLGVFVGVVISEALRRWIVATSPLREWAP